MNDYIKITAMAESLGVSRMTVLRLVAENAFATHRVGNHHRARKVDFEAFRSGYLNEQRESHGAHS